MAHKGIWKELKHLFLYVIGRKMCSRGKIDGGIDLLARVHHSSKFFGVSYSCIAYYLIGAGKIDEASDIISKVSSNITPHSPIQHYCDHLRAVIILDTRQSELSRDEFFRVNRDEFIENSLLFFSTKEN